MRVVTPLLMLAALASSGGANTSLKIEHEPITCLLKDRFPLLEATIEPASNVTKAQIFFKTPLAEAFHSVPMAMAFNRFRAKLPKPKQKPGTVVYFIEATDAAGVAQRTPEISMQVVKQKEACPEGGTVAPEGPEGDVRIYATTVSPRKPDGFSGIAGVTTTAQAAAPSPTPEPAQAPPPTGEAPPVTVAAIPTPVPPGVVPPAPADEFEYQIGPNDILKIVVYGYDDASQTVLVQSDGTFMYPLIGRVKASDMTAKELERKVAVLLGKGYIRNPQVTVNVQEARSRSVYVLGEVSRAGSYSLADAKTILDLAARAGISNTADIQIVRPRGNVHGPVLPSPADGSADPADPTKQTDILRVSMRDIQGGDLSKNLPLRPNDTIFVVAGKRVYVLGEVRSPGAFAPPPGSTVDQMILSAGGFTERASKGSIRITRQTDAGKKEFKAKPDEVVLPGDIITVKAKLF